MQTDEVVCEQHTRFHAIRHNCNMVDIVQHGHLCGVARWCVNIYMNGHSRVQAVTDRQIKAWTCRGRKLWHALHTSEETHACNHTSRVQHRNSCNASPHCSKRSIPRGTHAPHPSRTYLILVMIPTKRCVKVVYVVDYATRVRSLRHQNVPGCIGSLSIRISNTRQPDA